VNPNVALTTQSVTGPNGRRYTYWQLRWFSPDGRRYSENIGRIDKLSKRQANKLRQEKENELNTHPVRRELSRIPALGEFLATYLESRRGELAPRTHELHEQTVRYLKAHFGEHRRIDEIKRYHAREFKTALGNGQLQRINKRRHAPMQPRTVDLHIRNAKTVFNQAVDDDLIEVNPFDRLTGGVPPADKNWHYVSIDELNRLLAAAPNHGWRTLLGLCRLAGLRQAEALTLPWEAVDWEKRRLMVWASKTKRRRVVPIAPELLPILEDARDDALGDEPLIVTGIVKQNLWRDFRVICKRAGVEPYAKWCHTLRKNRESDWMAAGFPFHVVVDWMGHSDEVARQHYLRVNDADLNAAALTQIGAVLTQKLTQIEDSGPESDPEPDPQIINLEEFKRKAGDGIRTHDVQLGKLAFYH
jgi:integrase